MNLLQKAAARMLGINDEQMTAYWKNEAELARKTVSMYDKGLVSTPGMRAREDGIMRQLYERLIEVRLLNKALQRRRRTIKNLRVKLDIAEHMLRERQGGVEARRGLAYQAYGVSRADLRAADCDAATVERDANTSGLSPGDLRSL